MIRTTLRVALLLLAVLLPAGCSDDDPTGPGGGLPPDPVTRDQAAANLMTAWAEMDVDLLTEHVLHPDFRFLFRPDADEAPTTLWDRDREAAASAHLFSGESGVDSGGGLRPGVTGLDVANAVLDGDWTQLREDAGFPMGTWVGTYDVRLDVQLAGGTTLLRVDGRQRFYVVEEAGLWLVIGHQELPDAGKRSETTPWGTLKLIYDDPPEPGPYPFPATEDQLMANFKKAYDEMDRTPYVDDVLGSAYTFVFTEGSPYAPTNGWDRGTEVESATTMFAGELGYDTVQGVPKPGVGDVEFRTLIRLTDWEDVPLNDPDFPGARRALYEVELVFVLIADHSSTMTVSGQQIFYVSGEPVTINGVSRTRWRLCGQKDLTAEAKGNEDMSWGSVKSLYR